MTAGRYAPSPSGRMHLGNLLCCLLAWLSAKSKGGQVLLRIEDLDAARCPRRYADAIVDDLAWLGLAADGPQPPVYQSERAAVYQQFYDKLAAKGLVYPCFCSRSQLHAASAPHRSDGQVVYPGTCRGLTPEEIAEKARRKAPAWRVRVPDEEIAFTDGHLGPYAENLARDCGDFYLRRADGVFAYQLAVVVDDALMGVTEVVRGADLLSSTPRQLWLYRELGLQAPQFYHLPLLLDHEGRRLSQRGGGQGLGKLRARYTPQEIVGRLAFACGLQDAPRPAAPQDLVGAFDWARVPRHDIFLPEHLF
ncbi:tRNA glutamyl-Q(34) synthetase GluQRS [uncultured Subdoligranulum sp.]|uniref:tRNA glutamyl-Q(34) synthetase GluQRS n=1 Tax=uncultured Subdoligranulum sp. TaxID=512298 RepID=UPI002637EA32|nr:tRNA glutamyl-Q(34) synthetase GluQRS [uncultured Subdoligranulum sp.]